MRHSQTLSLGSFFLAINNYSTIALDLRNIYVFIIIISFFSFESFEYLK